MSQEQLIIAKKGPFSREEEDEAVKKFEELYVTAEAAIAELDKERTPHKVAQAARAVGTALDVGYPLYMRLLNQDNVSRDAKDFLKKLFLGVKPRRAGRVHSKYWELAHWYENYNHYMKALRTL